MSNVTLCIEVAVFSPLRQTFSYLAPDPVPKPGTRVSVPFGKGKRLGIVLATGPCPEGITAKPVYQVLDAEPLLPENLQKLLEFARNYYHHAPGEVWSTALPSLLCQGHAIPPPRQTGHILSAMAPRTGEGLRGRRQRDLLEKFRREGTVHEDSLLPPERQTMRTFIKRSWVEPAEVPPVPCRARTPAYHLGADQQEAVGQIESSRGFAPFLLEGVTGSGKTEVYLQVARKFLEAGLQALFLVPEIALIPQIQERCEHRFGTEHVAVYHSGLTDRERLLAWARAAQGQVRLLIGTRSSIFVPLARPALIVVDEEHDPSYKQQNGWLYSARDLAMRRAQLEKIPVVLGSATPSLETLQNVRTGRFQHLQLRTRANSAVLPKIEILPLRRRRLEGGLHPTLIQTCAETLEAGNQVLFFLNRRGYAPALLCHDCGTAISCPRCSSSLTWHQSVRRLRCHHCGHENPPPRHCPDCGSPGLLPAGAGTEQLEEHLSLRFPGIPLLRVDRDTIHTQRQLRDVLSAIHSQVPAILVGTQMLGKGHHFPAVAMVGIVNVDQGLYSADFRAGERLAQTVLQVAGRAGRDSRPGRVILQTHVPGHPLLGHLLQGTYGDAARHLLEEREAACLPPHTALALLRAEAHQAGKVHAFLEQARGCAPQGTAIQGPLPSLMERRAGFHRAQLWIEAPSRAMLQTQLDIWIPRLQAIPMARQVRWILDVDPHSF